MELYVEKHLNFVKQLGESQNDLQYVLSSHLRMNGVYWGLMTATLLNDAALLNKHDVVEFVLSCYDPKTGGFSADRGLDAHLLHTLSALQLLFLERSLDKLPNKEKTVEYIKSLQQENGGFSGDKYGEIDARFAYNAVQCLLLLNSLDQIDCTRTANWLARCQNFDGGFGFMPGEESHGAMAFTVIGGLNILNKLSLIDVDKAASWLADRQTQTGGLNGRPEKLPDVCYSWWVLSALAILNKVDWIDKTALQKFILSAQDPVNGGIADRPDNECDIFHTVFGIAGLSLLGYPNLTPIDPSLCLPLAEARALYTLTKS